MSNIPEYPSRTFAGAEGFRTVPWDDWVGMQRRALDLEETVNRLLHDPVRLDLKASREYAERLEDLVVGRYGGTVEELRAKFQAPNREAPAQGAGQDALTVPLERAVHGAIAETGIVADCIKGTHKELAHRLYTVGGKLREALGEVPRVERGSDAVALLRKLVNGSLRECEDGLAEAKEFLAAFDAPEEKHTRCFNDQPGAVLCQVCGGDLFLSPKEKRT